MSPNILLALIGFVTLAFLGIALVAWTIRSHREEMGDNALPPAPVRAQNLSGRIEISRIGPPSVPSRPRNSIGQEALPSAGSPPVAGNDTLFGRLLGGILPGLGDLSEMAEAVHRKEVELGRPLNEDEKKQAALTALEELTRRHPENPLFAQMLESLRRVTDDAIGAAQENLVQVSKVGGKITLSVNGEVFLNVEDIPDAETREQARRLIDSLGGG